MSTDAVQPLSGFSAQAVVPEQDILLVRHRLAEVLHNSLPDLEQIATHPSLIGGKLLRARLLLACEHALFELDRPAAIDLAVVLELAHLATLLHDDVIDAETVRRHSNTFRSEMGNRSSVLAGDFVFTRAVVLLASANSPDCVNIFAKAVSGVLEGELVQNSQCGNLDLGEDRYLSIIRMKTGTLFRTACELAVAGKNFNNENDRQLLAEVGMLIGTAYQLADDYADYFGDSRKLGKPMGRDYSAAVITLPLIHAISRSPAVREEAERSCGRGPLPAETLQCLVGQMRQLGSDEHVNAKVSSYVHTARDILRRLAARGMNTSALAAYIDHFASSVSSALLAQ